MFPVLQEVYGKNAIIPHGYKGKVSGKEFECDYLIETKDENIIVELKGYKKDNMENLIQKQESMLKIQYYGS